ncbi:hypothetical protein C8Q77DRAFT_200419 [Trametes polyzona]|nr:hypothetical protein C8Q77DRAFT_200419 [Trametes polyzona]
MQRLELDPASLSNRYHLRGDSGRLPVDASFPACPFCAFRLAKDCTSALARLVARTWRPELCPHDTAALEPPVQIDEFSDNSGPLRYPIAALLPSKECPNKVPGEPYGFNSLPPSLSSTILKLVVLEESAAYRGWCPPTTILPLMRVSRHWRALAVSTASFWRYIDTSRPMPWVSLCLERSRSCPLDVFVAFPKRGHSAALDLVLPHAHRFRSFAAHIPWGYQGKGCYWKRLGPFFELGMPELERLEIVPIMTDMEGNTPVRERVADFGPGLCRARMPRLRWLSAGMVALPAPADFWRTLRVFHLRRGYFAPDGTPRPWDDLAKILVQNTGLEELHVRLFDDDGSGESGGLSVGSILLSRLRSYSFLGAGSTMGEIRSRIMTPDGGGRWCWEHPEYLSKTHL